jgi:hypothetical protein
MTTNIALGLGAAGLGLSAFGISKEVDAENQANRYNAQLASNNALIAEQNAAIEEQRAAQVRERGRVAQERLRESREVLKGAQRAGFAASGVEVDTGSAADVVEETAAQTELDALMIQHNAELEAFDFEMSARNERLRGRELTQRSQLLQSRSDRSAALPVATELLTGGSRLIGRVL